MVASAALTPQNAGFVAPSAQSYALVQRIIGDKIPDSLNRAIVLWYGLQAPPSISIKLELPEGAKNFLKLAPTPAVMNLYAQKANADAINRGLTIIPEVLSEPQKLPQTLGTAALQITQVRSCKGIRSSSRRSDRSRSHMCHSRWSLRQSRRKRTFDRRFYSPRFFQRLVRFQSG
jgi:hypothetical protein